MNGFKLTHVFCWALLLSQISYGQDIFQPIEQVYWIDVPQTPQIFSDDQLPPRIAFADEAPEPVAEEDDSVDVKELQKQLEDLQKSWDDYQDGIKDAKKKAASKPTFQIGGRIHADYWAFPNTSPGIGFFEHPAALDPRFGSDPEDFFAFRRVRLEMKGDILETGYWRIQVDFNNFGTPEAKDVFIGFKELPGNHRLQIGNQKRPLGLDHLNSSRYNVFLERPLVVESFNEDARRPGITLYGNNDDESLGWAFGGYLLQNITTDGRYRGDAYQGSLNGRLFGSPWYDESSGGRGYYHWAVAGMWGHPNGNANPLDAEPNEGRFRTRPEGRTESRWFDTGRIPGAHNYEVLAFEQMLNVGPFQLTGEYQANWLQRAGGLQDCFFHGGYVFAAYNLTGEHIPYDRRSGTIGRLKPFENFFLVDRCCGGTGAGWGAWQLAARYDYIDLTDNGITGGVGNSGTLALNWFFNAYAKLQFNLIYGTIDQRGPIGGFSSGDYLVTGTRLAIEF